jgi:transcriptional regulator with XRE-family HTH domain
LRTSFRSTRPGHSVHPDMPLAKEEFARRMRQARQRRNPPLTQRDIADALNTDWRVVQRWDTGQAIPKPKTLVRLADTLGVDIDYLREPQSEHVLERIERKVNENGNLLRSTLGLIEDLRAQLAAADSRQAALLKDQEEFLRALGAPVPPTATDAAAQAQGTRSKKTRGTRREDG